MRTCFRFEGTHCAAPPTGGSPTPRTRRWRTPLGPPCPPPSPYPGHNPQPTLQLQATLLTTLKFPNFLSSPQFLQSSSAELCFTSTPLLVLLTSSDSYQHSHYSQYPGSPQLLPESLKKVALPVVPVRGGQCGPDVHSYRAQGAPLHRQVSQVKLGLAQMARWLGMMDSWVEGGRSLLCRTSEESGHSVDQEQFHGQQEEEVGLGH